MAKVTRRQPLQRRLNLVDLCVLVVATAVGLVAIRQDLVGLLSWPQDWKTGRAVQLWTDPIALSKAVEIWLMAWMAGWFILQLRRPRLHVRQLSRQPGFVACFRRCSLRSYPGL
jgi:hypothetical protein